ncbi:MULTISPECIES: hypothetical protein [Mammaliicoccus]|jgi:hypothetical protein|uniref:hypothetical protein n=1 Tax=Mammaliicoccus TaxID=2803850 RepID=UPI001C4F9EA8|nr:hypothetical protein [Mammaliicoccus lentus]MBW0761329.1 hypothetical protein [Mammaliicoccus lentus]
MNEQNIQANQDLVVNNLLQEIARLSHENAVYKAIIQEQNSQGNQEPTQSE